MENVTNDGKKNMHNANSVDAPNIRLHQKSTPRAQAPNRPRLGSVKMPNGKTAYAKGNLFMLSEDFVFEMAKGFVAPPDHPRSSRLRIVNVKANIRIGFDSLNRSQMQEALDRFVIASDLKGVVASRTGLTLVSWRIRKRYRPFASNRFEVCFKLVSHFGFGRDSLQAIREAILPNVSSAFWHSFASEVTWRGRVYPISSINMIPWLVTIDGPPGPTVLSKLTQQGQGRDTVMPVALAA